MVSLQGGRSHIGSMVSLENIVAGIGAVSEGPGSHYRVVDLV